MAVKLSVNRAVIVSVVKAKSEGGGIYIGVETDAGRLNMSSKSISFDDADKLRLVPIAFDAEVRFSVYDRNLRCELLSWVPRKAG